MRKRWAFVAVFLMILMLFGCGKKDDIINTKYTYVIHKGDPLSVQAQSGEYEINTGVVYGYPVAGNQEYGWNQGVSLYRVHSDGRKERVDAIWAVDPPELGFWERENKIWANQIFTAQPGIGKIKAYVAEDDTYAERDIIVYDVAAISSVPHELSIEDGVILPNYIDFSPEIEGADITFDGNRIIGEIFKTENNKKIFNIKNIPAGGYVSELPYDGFWSSYIVQTKEGYYVKIEIGLSLINPDIGFSSHIYYYVEKNSTTEFKY